ncbi:MAG: hypothetical protein RJA99_3535 [Pseudomonadota bacterium]|jgi:outer membrane usher protein
MRSDRLLRHTIVVAAAVAAFAAPCAGAAEPSAQQAPVPAAGTPIPIPAATFPPSAGSPSPDRPADGLAVVLYEVTVNGELIGAARLVRLPGDRLLARRDDLIAWRFRLPAGLEPQSVLGEPHLPLETIDGLTIRVDPVAQALVLDAPPTAFTTTEVQAMAMPVARAVPPAPGLFLNYDLFHSRTTAAELVPATHSTSAQLEFGLFGPAGIGTAGFLLQAQGDAQQSRQVRLDTSWTIDQPDRMRTLVLGDTVGASGYWGRPVRYGGVRWGTNFATNPTYVTFPMPGLRGEAALPTVTDLYIDGLLRQTTSVQPGPFRITNLPVITGQGEVRLVMRDLLGREQVVALPYYASSQLLSAGLVDESYELGMVRENYGLASNDYGRAIGAWQRRQGLTDTLTTELRAEASADARTAGAGASVAVRGLGVLTAAAAASDGPRGGGTLGAFGWERLSRNGVSFGVRGQWATEAFTQIGQPIESPSALRLVSGNVGMSMGAAGSIGMSYVRQDYRDRPGAEIASVSWSLNLGRAAALVLTGYRSTSPEPGHAVTLSLVTALDGSTSASASVSGPSTDPRTQVQVQRNLPQGSGAGWRVLAAEGASGMRLEAGASWQGSAGTVSGEIGRAAGVEALRAGASGALALVGGRMFPSRRLGDAFGVVHVPGFSDVGVMVNNQLVARTDAEGWALVPRLLPYLANPVRIETGDLPIDTTIDATELVAVPFARSAALLRFPVKRSAGALLTLVLEDGEPMPVGAEVRVPGVDETFMVAYRGEAYVTGLDGPGELTASWNGQQCVLRVDPGQNAGVMPRLGPIVCRGVSR